MKNIAILGSTGSIGTQTLAIVREQKDIKVWALAAGKNIDLLERQIREFAPVLAAVWEEEDAKKLRTKVSDLSVRIVSGMDGMIEVAVFPQAEMLVTAIVGMIGLRPTVAAIRAKKQIALANNRRHCCRCLRRKRFPQHGPSAFGPPGQRFRQPAGCRRLCFAQWHFRLPGRRYQRCPYQWPR